MSLSRRKFIRTGALGLAGTALFGSHLLAAPKNVVMGIQLYSVRADMDKDPEATLKLLAAMGYKNVEHANYHDGKFYGYAPAEFKKMLDDLGLSMHSGHTRLGAEDWNRTTRDFTDTWKQTIADAAIVGQQYVISPWLDDQYRKSYDDLRTYMGVFNKNGELCRKAGMKFGYHNHNFEFSTKLENKTLYEIILENTDPNLVAQQIDIGNMYGAGGRAMDLIKKYPGRFELMHVKDEIRSTAPDNMDGYESTLLGKGVIQTREIVDLGLKSGGTKHFIIEQESYQAKTPLESARIDNQVMKNWGF